MANVPLLRSLASEDDYPMLYNEFSMVTSRCAEYGAAHAVWKHKRTYLAGRPLSVMRHLSINTNTTFAAEAPEYPSGSCAIYSAFAQAADDWFMYTFELEDASKKTGPLSFTVPASHFYWSNGPKSDVTLEYENLNEWVEECPVSRIYGGVHFMEAGIAGITIGKEVGHACTRLLKTLKDGDMTSATYLAATRESISAFL